MDYLIVTLPNNETFSFYNSDATNTICINFKQHSMQHSKMLDGIITAASTMREVKDQFGSSWIISDFTTGTKYGGAIQYFKFTIREA